MTRHCRMLIFIAHRHRSSSSSLIFIAHIHCSSSSLMDPQLAQFLIVSIDHFPLVSTMAGSFSLVSSWLLLLASPSSHSSYWFRRVPSFRRALVIWVAFFLVQECVSLCCFRYQSHRFVSLWGGVLRVGIIVAWNIWETVLVAPFGEPQVGKKKSPDQVLMISLTP